MTSRQLRVVTHKTWLTRFFADDRLVKTDARIHGVEQDFGFDINYRTATSSWWWAPGAWVASAYAADVDIPLLSCGTRWMLGLPYEYVKRKILVCTVDEAAVVLQKHVAHGLWQTDRVFVKLPESKLDSAQAGLFTIAGDLTADIIAAGFDSDAVVQLSEEIEIGIEARFFVLNRSVAAYSLYKTADGVTWGDDAFDTASAIVTATDEFSDLYNFAAAVAADPRTTQPPGWVLDVGMTANGPVVIEANAAWSSGPYDCDPYGVVNTIIAAHDIDGEYAQWRWRPENALKRRVRALRRL